MQTNMLRGKALVQEKTSTRSAMGASVEWSEGESYWCRRVPVDAATKLAYQQQNTVVTDKFIFEGNIDLKYDVHRITFEDVTYNLVEAGLYVEGFTTVLTVRA